MNNIVRAVKTNVLVCSVAVLTACGGGGGGDATTPSSLNFSLLSAWQDHTKKSLSQNFTISGTCSGSGSYLVQPIRPDSGGSSPVVRVPGTSYSQTSTASYFYSNCAGSGSQSTTTYYDGNYHPVQTLFPEERGSLAGSTQQLAYVYSYNASIPSSVRVGDRQTIASVQAYYRSCWAGCDFSNYSVGDLSVVIRPDTADSVFADLVVRLPDRINTSTYRLTSTGMLTPIQDVIEGGSVKEVWTY